MANQHPHHRRAVTRAGVIVVAFILLVVLLTLPTALIRLRQSAHQTECADNLRHAGMAFYLHWTRYSWFPDGGESPHAERTWANRVPAVAPHQTWGWGYQALPYLNQGKLYRQANEGRLGPDDFESLEGRYVALWLNPDDGAVKATPVRVYFCPARRHPSAVDGQAGIDYAGNGGTDRASGRNGTVPQRGRALPISPLAIPDGAAYTLLIGEKWYDPTSRAGDEAGYTAGFGPDVIRWAVEPPLPDGAAGGGPGLDRLLEFALL